MNRRSFYLILTLLNFLVSGIILTLHLLIVSSFKEQQSESILSTIRKDFIKGDRPRAFEFLSKHRNPQSENDFVSIKFYDPNLQDEYLLGDRYKDAFNQLNHDNSFLYNSIVQKLYFDQKKSEVAATFTFYYYRFPFFKYTIFFVLFLNILSFCFAQIVFRRKENEFVQREITKKKEAVAEATQMLAHDLKGPLAVFQKVAFGTPKEFLKEKENLVRALNRLTSMADSIKRADLESQIRPYKCRLDLDETISSARSYAEKHSISLLIEGEPIEGIQIDLPKVERAVSNLLFNAIEAANSIVEISWLLEGAKLSILVKDDGDGVPNKLIPKLFTRGATHGKENGTGLGLAFVDHVAKGHGGKVEYQREGKTSMFKLVLEDVKVADEPQAVETLDQKSGKFLINREKNSLILVKLKDSVEEQRLSNELATNLDVVISNSFEDLSNCHIFFTDNSSLLLRDYPENVRVIMNRPEKAETVLRGLLEVQS